MSNGRDLWPQWHPMSLVEDIRQAQREFFALRAERDALVAKLASTERRLEEIQAAYVNVADDDGCVVLQAGWPEVKRLRDAILLIHPIDPAPVPAATTTGGDGE